jgi:hypothetical protein
MTSRERREQRKRRKRKRKIRLSTLKDDIFDAVTFLIFI